MTAHESQGRRIIAELMQSYSGADVQPADMQMVAEGASGRCIMRSAHPAGAGLIGIYWTADRADNASFLPAAHGLRKAGVRVPAVLAEQDVGNGCGACLVEDLGQKSLLSLRDAPRHERRAAYVSALHQLHKLHGTHPDWPLQPAFDASLYRWEQNYFAEHYLTRHRGMPTEQVQQLLSAPPWQQLATRLAELPRVPLHRDCQSQNIMLRDGEAWFIDFQGMRLGLPEYDLASLLYDPYMELTDSERDELLAHWSGICHAPLRRDVLAGCALQRIMQALGAFANIGYNARNTWYLDLIPAGERALNRICASAPSGSLAAQLALCLSPFVTPSE